MKKSVKLLAILLSIIMSFGALPAAVFAAQDNVIDTIEIVDVTAPAFGEVISFDWSVPENSGYGPVDHVDTCQWFELGLNSESIEDAYSNGLILQSSSHNEFHFYPGYYYSFSAFVVADEGYEFSSDVKATINGMEAMLRACDDNTIEVFYCFEKIPEAIEIYFDYEPEVQGQMIYNFDVPSRGSYSKYNDNGDSVCAWVETDTDPADYEDLCSNGVWYYDNSEALFMPNKYYTFVVFVYSDEGFAPKTPAFFYDEPSQFELINENEVAVWCPFGLLEFSPCTISFDANGGEGVMSDTQTDELGNYVLPECTFTPPEGKVFSKWLVCDIFSSYGRKEFEGTIITANSDVLLIAQWQDASEAELLNTIVLKNGKAYKNRITDEELTDVGISGAADGQGYVYTFNGVDFSTDAEIAVAVLDKNATIYLAPDSLNTIVGGEKNDEWSNYGIRALGNLIITGSGTLNASMKDSYYENIALWAEKNLTINDGIINASGAASEEMEGIGICVLNNLIINGGVVNANGATINSGSSIGIYVCNNLIMNGGNLTGTAGEVSEEYCCNIGIEVANNMLVKGGTVVGNGGKATGESTYSCGFYVEGVLNIEDGTVVGNGGEVSGDYTYSYGFCVEGVLKAKDGNVTGNAGEISGDYSCSYGFSAGEGLIVNGGTVTGNGVYGIEVYNNIKVNSGKVTGNGKEESGENENSKGIVVCGSLTVNAGEVIGEGGDAYDYSCGIYVDEELTVNAGSVKGTGGKVSNKYSDSTGIDVYGDIEVNGGKVIGTGGEALNDYSSSYGIYANYLTVNDGKIIGTGGDASGESYGIYIDNDFIVKGGTVTGTSGKVSGYSSDSKGIKICGNLTVENATVTGTGWLGIEVSKAITVTNGTVSGAGVYGVYVDGKVTVNDGVVTGSYDETVVGENDKISGSDGIYVFGDFDMNGGTVTGSSADFSSDNHGIFIYGKLNMSDGTITGLGGEASGNSASSYGIYVSKVITLDGGTVKGVGGKASSESANSYGVYTYGGIDSNGGELIGIGGEVTAKQGSSRGIFVAYGKSLNADGGKVTGIGGDVTYNGDDGSANYLFSYGIALYDFTANDGIVDGIAGDVLGENGNSYGVYMEHSGSFNVNKGGIVTGKGGTADNSYGYYFYNQTEINGGTATFSGNSAAICGYFEQPKTPSESDIEVIAGEEADGSDAVKLDNWVGDGLDVLSDYKYMRLWDGVKILVGIEIVEEPTTKEYTLNESTSTEGLKVIAKYQDGSESDVTNQVEVKNFNASEVGSKTATVEFEGKTAAFNYTVIEPALVSIRIDSAPTKTQYLYNTTTSTEGLKVTAVYSDGSEVDITNQVEVKNFNASEVGSKTATVEFEGKTAAFNYTVIEPVLVSIRIDSAPATMQYRYKAKTSTEGLKVTAVYSDGSEVDITNQVEVKDFDSAKVGDRTATVEFEGQTAEFKYSVKYTWWQMIIRIILLGFLWY